ncbi:SGNH/GDSL hydrolase family protein [soil metagenome]
MTAPAGTWSRFVAVGDSLTEGLSDESRQQSGEYRGWADRLATFLASAPRGIPLQYANLAVRSRRVRDVLDDQIPRAIELRADLVSVLVGANDLVRRRADPVALAHRLSQGIVALRESGADVLLVTAFAPHRPYLRPLHARLAEYNAVLENTARQTGAMLVDFWRDPICHDSDAWAVDRVHLSSHGHRMLSYRAAAALGISGAHAIGELDAAAHDLGDNRIPTARWLWVHARPWAYRRLRGRTAGDGLSPKHSELAPVPAVAQNATSGGISPATPPEVAYSRLRTRG